MNQFVIKKKLGTEQIKNRRLASILALLVVLYITAVIAFIIAY
jgi:hypothetical protein